MVYLQGLEVTTGKISVNITANIKNIFELTKVYLKNIFACVIFIDHIVHKIRSNKRKL